MTSFNYKIKLLHIINLGQMPITNGNLHDKTFSNGTVSPIQCYYNKVTQEW